MNDAAIQNLIDSNPKTWELLNGLGPIDVSRGLSWYGKHGSDSFTYSSFVGLEGQR